jgi:uncharacterized protein YndB with AHSA1/START domain
MNPDLDLTLQRVIRAPRAVVWSAWTDPSRLEKWWVPAPTVCRVDRLDVWPGGGFGTRLRAPNKMMLTRVLRRW